MEAAARLSLRLRPDTKTAIEQAACISGQNVSDFAVTILAKAAQEVLDRHFITQLTNRDRDLFLAMLDADASPSDALAQAVDEYRQGRVEGEPYTWTL